MFFTRVGQVVAWLTFVLGTFQVFLGFVGAATVDTVQGRAEFARRYLGSNTTGSAIDNGQMLLVVGIALGILVEISLHIAKDDVGSDKTE